MGRTAPIGAIKVRNPCPPLSANGVESIPVRARADAALALRGRERLRGGAFPSPPQRQGGRGLPTLYLRRASYRQDGDPLPPARLTKERKWNVITTLLLD